MSDYSKIIFKYILLKIQSDEWARGFRIPSERWFCNKFYVSKAVISIILKKLKEAKVIYSVPQKGYFVAPNNLLFNYFKNETHVHYACKISEVKAKLSNEDIKFIASVEEVSNMKFRCVVKKFYDEKNVHCKTIIVFIPQAIFEKSNTKLIEESTMKFYAYSGHAISKKVYLQIRSNSSAADGIIEPNGFNEGIELIYNTDNELCGIIKSVFYNHFEKPTNVFIKDLSI